jgi:hypothetical protein
MTTAKLLLQLRLQPQSLAKKLRDRLFHLFHCPLTQYINVSVIGVSTERTSSLLKLLVKFVQKDIRQQRR